MNIDRTHTINVSGAELREALKLRFPDSHIIQALPAANGRVTVAMAGSGLRIDFTTQVADV